VGAKSVIKRVKLPAKTCTRLQHEARKRRCSISALVANAVLRDLEEREKNLKRKDEHE
jgi:hypothetical protein